MIDTFSPDWLTEPSFQALVIFWSPAKVNANVQLLMADVPALPMDTLAVKPPAHSLDVVYVTWQTPPLVPVPIVQVNVADPDAPVVSVAVTVTVLDAAAAGVPEISPAEGLIDRPAGRPVAL